MTSVKKQSSENLFLGNSCNNNCLYCPQNIKTKNGIFVSGNAKDKSTTEIKDGIFQISQKNYDIAPIEKIINFIGGEPTIRKDILELISYAKSLGFKVMLTSNGRMFAYEKFAQKIVEAGLDFVQVSIQGSKPDIHDRITSVKGSYEQTMRGLENLKNHKISLFNKTNILESNLHDLEDIVRLLLDYKVKQFTFSLPSSEGNIKFSKDQHVKDLKKLSKYLNRTMIKVKELGKDAFVESLPFCILYDHFENISGAIDSEGHKDHVCNKCIFFAKCPGLPKGLEEHLPQPISKTFLKDYEILKRCLDEAPESEKQHIIVEVGHLYLKNALKDNAVNYYLYGIHLSPKGQDCNPLRAFFNYYKDKDVAIEKFFEIQEMNPKKISKFPHIPSKDSSISDEKIGQHIADNINKEFNQYIKERRKGELKKAKEILFRILKRNPDNVILLNELNALNNQLGVKGHDTEKKIDSLFKELDLNDLNFYSPYLDTFSHNLSEMIALLGNIKPLMRNMVFSEDFKKLANLKDIIKTHGLSMEISPYKVYYGTFPELVLPFDTEKRDATIDFFISKDKNAIREAMINDFESRIFPGKDMTYNFGKALGYPDCCSKAFTGFKKEKYYSEISTVNKIDFVVNGLLQGHGNIFLSHHTPCSIHCKKTRKLNNAILKEIRNFDYLFYKTIQNTLKKPILIWIDRDDHARNNWILKPRMIFSGTRYSNNTLSYKNAHGLPPLNQFRELKPWLNEISTFFQKGNRIKIDSEKVYIMKDNTKIKEIENSEKYEAVLFLPS